MPATSEKQKRFMQAVANNPQFAKQVGVPQSVGKEFTMKKYQDGKAVKKEEKLSPGDAADRAAMRDFGNKSFLQPPKKGPKAGTYTGSMKKSGSKFPDLTGDGKVGRQRPQENGRRFDEVRWWWQSSWLWHGPWRSRLQDGLRSYKWHSVKQQKQP